MLLVDASSTVIYANLAAKEILAAGDGISESRGKLRAMNLGDGVNLQAALNHAVIRDLSLSRASIEHPIFAIRRKAGRPLVAVLVPSNNTLVEATDIAATMYLVDPGRNIANMLAPFAGFIACPRWRRALLVNWRAASRWPMRRRRCG